MPFNFKDLMVHVVPDKPAGGGGEGCGNCSLATANWNCTVASTMFCTPASTMAMGGFCGMATGPGTQCGVVTGQAAFACGPATGPVTQCGPISFGAMAAAPQSAANLAAVKQQLQQALAHVEAQEKVLAVQQKPQDLAEAEDLHQKMTAALAELQQHIDGLQKQPPGGDKKP